MRRSISALGGALVALTLACGPAWAGTSGEPTATSLPLTGLRAWLLVGAGVWLLASGLAVLLATSLFKGAAAGRDEEDGRFAR